MEQLKQIKLIIFDIDGVLVDVSNSYRLAIKKTVEFFHGNEIHPEEIQQLKNESGYNNDWDLTEELLKRKGQQIPREEIVHQFQSYYWGDNGNGLIQTEKWLLDNELLKQISKKYSLAIFTGRPKLEAEFVLNKNKVKDFFDPIIAMEDVSKGKPNPEGLNTIVKSNSLPPSKVCYLGDTFDDIRSAKRAGVIAIGVLPPKANKNLKPKLIEEGAVIAFDEVNELRNFIP